MAFPKKLPKVGNDYTRGTLNRRLQAKSGKCSAFYADGNKNFLGCAFLKGYARRRHLLKSVFPAAA